MDKVQKIKMISASRIASLRPCWILPPTPPTRPPQFLRIRLQKDHIMLIWSLLSTCDYPYVIFMSWLKLYTKLRPLNHGRLNWWMKFIPWYLFKTRPAPSRSECPGLKSMYQLTALSVQGVKLRLCLCSDLSPISSDSALHTVFSFTITFDKLTVAHFVYKSKASAVHGSRWSCVVNLTHLALCCRVVRAVWRTEKCIGATEIRSLDRPACSLVTELSGLQCCLHPPQIMWVSEILPLWNLGKHTEFFPEHFVMKF
jgi:hypothetical protein